MIIFDNVSKTYPNGVKGLSHINLTTVSYTHLFKNSKKGMNSQVVILTESNTFYQRV